MDQGRGNWEDGEPVGRPAQGRGTSLGDLGQIFFLKNLNPVCLIWATLIFIINFAGANPTSPIGLAAEILLCPNCAVIIFNPAQNPDGLPVATEVRIGLIAYCKKRPSIHPFYVSSLRNIREDWTLL